MNKRQLIAIASVSLIIIGVAFAYYMISRYAPNFTVKATTAGAAKPHHEDHVSTSTLMTVYIVGAVKVPGVYKVRPGTRLYELVDYAGGFLPGADVKSLNLARKLRDGEKITVPKGYSGSSVKVSSQKELSPLSSGRIDINAASVEELKKLPGVGPKIAQRIVGYRNTHGGFRSPQELIRVKGIGEKKLKKILPFVVVR